MLSDDHISTGWINRVTVINSSDAVSDHSRRKQKEQEEKKEREKDRVSLTVQAPGSPPEPDIKQSAGSDQDESMIPPHIDIVIK